jgi:ATP-dependent Zn protease
MSSKQKIAVTCGVLVCVAGVLWMTTTGQGSPTMYTYSQFLDQVHSGQVASVVVIGSNSGVVEATCRLRDGKTARTVLPSDYKDALLAMQDKLVNIEIRAFSPEPLRLFMKATPFLLLLGIWVVLMILKFPNNLKQALLG